MGERGKRRKEEEKRRRRKREKKKVDGVLHAGILLSEFRNTLGQ